MSAWRVLEHELDAWAAAGLAATIWWRDDDASEPTPALDRLLSLADRTGAPLALAVIPALTGAALADRLADSPSGLDVLQHGYAHRNHGPTKAKKIELDDDRPESAVAQELLEGRKRLAEAFGSRFRPVLVPPWNRIGQRVTQSLTSIGFSGLSGYGARSARHAAPGLLQVNCHLDIMRWRPRREFLGSEEAGGRLAAHLRARRSGGADREEATGILTHHLVHDQACWHFLEGLMELLCNHSAVRMRPAAALFADCVAGAARRSAGEAP